MAVSLLPLFMTQDGQGSGEIVRVPIATLSAQVASDHIGASLENNQIGVMVKSTSLLSAIENNELILVEVGNG